MILSSYSCPVCGEVEMMVASPAPDTVACDCGAFAVWLPTPIRGSVRVGEVTRGPVAKPDSPMYCATRDLGAGIPLSEWKARRRKLYQERRWKERKDVTNAPPSILVGVEQLLTELILHLLQSLL